MDIRIFKVLSGELVIGKLVSADFQSPFDSQTELSEVRLQDTKSFNIAVPCTLAYGPHGPQLVPFLGWVEPDAEATAQFSGSSVLFEVLGTVEGGKHDRFLSDYRSYLSPILSVKKPAVSLVR